MEGFSAAAIGYSGGFLADPSRYGSRSIRSGSFGAGVKTVNRLKFQKKCFIALHSRRSEWQTDVNSGKTTR
jgi:hypothetical protein